MIWTQEGLILVRTHRKIYGKNFRKIGYLEKKSPSLQDTSMTATLHQLVVHCEPHPTASLAGCKFFYKPAVDNIFKGI